MAATPEAVGEPITPAEAFNTLLSMAQGRLTNLVAAIPAEMYDFAPSAAIFIPSQQTEFTEVLSVAQAVAHIAGGNYGIGKLIAGLEPE